MLGILLGIYDGEIAWDIRGGRQALNGAWLMSQNLLYNTKYSMAKWISGIKHDILV